MHISSQVPRGQQNEWARKAAAPDSDGKREKAEGVPLRLPHFFFFAEAFFAGLLAFAFAGALAAFFFGDALGFGMDFGSQSRDRVVDRRPQLSQ
jgi:hypothetical protein